MADDKVSKLETQIQALQLSKLELIRSTSTEIERLRQIIRTLVDPQNTNSKLVDSLRYQPLTTEEIKQLKLSFPSLQQSIPEQQKQKETHHVSNGYSNNNNSKDNQSRTNGVISSSEPTLNEPIPVEPWPKRPLGSLHEYEEHQYHNEYNTEFDLNKQNNDESEHKAHSREDTLFRLNTKRMSYKGFEFSDFGFMTTDFDQLSRGHTQWVNQVMHHPVQNGIVITASDDWCVMFWRFRKAIGNEELNQEKIGSMFNKQKNKLKSGQKQQQKQQQHLVGEIELLPVLKINTGLEVKAIAMSSDGTILACACYDEEEDEGNPEIQLYFDHEQKWCFKHHQFTPYYSNNHHRQNNEQQTKTNKGDTKTERIISRKIKALPFEPVPHAIVFTRDNKYLFVAMYSSHQILEELRSELEEEYGTNYENIKDEDVRNKYADHPIPLIVLNVHTRIMRECSEIYQYLSADEHVTCISISPNGARIAIGTNNGNLIVTGVLKLTGDFEDADAEFNPLLEKIWCSPSNDSDGSLTSLDWSQDSNWIICGHASGIIKFWKRQNEKRLSVQVNRTIGVWMNKSNVKRKNKMFTCKWYLEGLHIEAVNSLSIRGSLMVSGADDGSVLIHDLMETFVDGIDINSSSKMNDNSPITIGKIDKIHGGRMVNSVCLSKNYSEENLLIPSTGLFCITSGADNVVHCFSLLDVCRDSIRKKYYKNKQNQQSDENN